MGQSPSDEGIDDASAVFFGAFASSVQAEAEVRGLNVHFGLETKGAPVYEDIEEGKFFVLLHFALQRRGHKRN